MPPSETRISALQRQLADSPNDPELYVELAREFEALRYHNRAVDAYFSAARAFERMDAMGAAVAVLRAVLAIEPHHQYARRQYERLSALAAFTEADDFMGERSASFTVSAEIAWGQGIMPLATADLEQVEGMDPRAEQTDIKAVLPSAAVMPLSTADLSFVELPLREDDDTSAAGLDDHFDTAVVVRKSGGSFDATTPELALPTPCEASLRFVGPALPPRLLEQASMERIVAGQQIFSVGDLASDLFQLLEGRVELLWAAPGGTEAFALVEPGAIFGVLGLLAGGQRTLDARVHIGGELARIDHAVARAHSQHDPEFDRLLRKAYRDRLVFLAQQASPLLRALSDADTRQIFAVGRPLAVVGGGLVVDRDVRPKGVLLVLLGQLRALDAAGRSEQVVGLGQCACHRALFAGETCSHALRAEAFVQLLVIPGKWLREAPEAKIIRYALQQQPDAAG